MDGVSGNAPNSVARMWAALHDVALESRLHRAYTVALFRSDLAWLAPVFSKSSPPERVSEPIRLEKASALNFLPHGLSIWL